MSALVLLAGVVGAAPVHTVTDDGCSLDARGRLSCFDVDDHCVQPSPQEPFREVFTVEQTSGCGLRLDQTVQCWGASAFARPPPTLGTVRQLSVSKSHACAVRADQTLRCWGDAAAPELEPPSGSFLQVAAGLSVSCAIRAGGTLACWGARPLRPPQGSFSSVSVGVQAACAIDAKGALTCWGDLPRAPPGTYSAVSVGTFVACARRTDGGAVCFGADGVARRVGPPGTRFSEVATRCGRLESGKLVCWTRLDPTKLQEDDGTTQIADASGACPSRASKSPAPVEPIRPVLQQLLGQVADGSIDTESARDRVERRDLPHLVSAYQSAKRWKEKTLLMELMQDYQEPVLEPVMWDALDVPDCDDDTCWWVRAVALSYLDGDFGRFSQYYDNRKATRAALTKRLAERASKKK
jgi:hypothetical protein